MTKILYFDCFAGISGDMILGALLDMGVDKTFLSEQLASLGLDGYRLSVSQKQVNGITGTDFDVILEDHAAQPVHRHLSDIEHLIQTSGIDDRAKELAISIFRLIAQSEAKIHGKSIEEIHFHEVGAIDSIIDIVGAAICLVHLSPDRIISSPLHLGSGTVTCAHGILPVPAPATADILTGIPVYSTDIQGELVTPTGAAIIKTIAHEFRPPPSFTMEKIGYGAGKKRFKLPNLLRVFWGEEKPVSDAVEKNLLFLETNIDDMNPETYSYLLPLLLEKGAMDAYLTPIIMKKGRPGIILSVLCEPEYCQGLEEILFTETSTLGLRKSAVQRKSLARKTILVETRYGPVRVKMGYLNGKALKSSPEYEDCKMLAEKHRVPLKTVYDSVLSSGSNLDT